ncbi:MAG: hypothetical protein ABSD62_02935 [Candidatus Limnocylindrales bacterium]
MRPFGFDEVEQLRYARSRAEMLREEWRMANSSAPGRRVGASSALTLKRVRKNVGHALIELGRRLLPADAGTRRAVVTARRPDWGC